MKQNIAIIGSRTFTDYNILTSFIKKFIDPIFINLIISGGAKGADKLGERFAQENNIETLIFKPNWKLGKGAGMIRNKDIIENSDLIFVFWNGISKGTKNSFNLAKKLNKQIYLYQFTTELS